MAAFAFPLTVKLLLASEGHYAITDSDEARLTCIDRLLAESDWWKIIGTHSNATTWQETLFKNKREVIMSNVIYKAVAEMKEIANGGNNMEMPSSQP